MGRERIEREKVEEGIQMGKVVERKKKKGRPSLLDLQRRTLKEEQEQQQQQQHHKRNNYSAPHSYANYRTATASTPNPLRRSTRRNPDDGTPEKVLTGEDDDDDEEELEGNRREKKLKLVLKMPQNKKSLNSLSLNSCGSDSNAEEDNTESNSGKQRKINAIGDGSVVVDGQKAGKSGTGTDQSNIHQGATKLDLVPSTPLPDKKLLLFVLDRLQKKDTYGVYAEPVDPNELPDYFEVIEHPMDFGTVRKKLASGAYANLEMFENDVFLICSNAMEYNTPDTIYFRQARSIQELAKKNFESLRQDSDGNDSDPKLVRRGRPPTKNKRPPGGPSLEHTASEFSSDATLVNGGENASWSNHDLRKGFADSFVRGSQDVHPNGLADIKFERNEDFTGSASRGISKYGKEQFILDENRRSTYLQSYPSGCGQRPSVLATFDREGKQLVPIGIHFDHSYARSVARFAANLGPVTWKVASVKIEMCLPAGVQFGPGWVGENDALQNRSLLIAPDFPGQPSQPQLVSAPVLTNSSSAATSGTSEPKENKIPEKSGSDNLLDTHASAITPVLDSQITKRGPVSATTSPSPEHFTAKQELVEGLRPNHGLNVLNRNINPVGPKPPFQLQQNPAVRPGMNGSNGAYEFNLPYQMSRFIVQPRPASLNIQSSETLGTASLNNSNFIHPATTANNLYSEESVLSKDINSKSSSSILPNITNEGLTSSTSVFHHRQSWRELSPHQKSDFRSSPQQMLDSVPPDLNVRFQSPGSPPCSSWADSMQPDLALQL